jgi:cobyrinic acid a,c-diamide synthase
VIAGTGSGVGKTTTTLGLIRAFQDRGLRVASFKCGPDYLDPTYHKRVSGRTCHNLDGWMMGREAVLSTFVEATKDADLAIVEGVMGLFDGLSPTSDVGSTAEIAKWIEAPVLLVVDASGMARTIAAIARGFVDFDPEVKIAGVICNFVGSSNHLSLLQSALASPPIVGGFSKHTDIAFPERHLGLWSADDQVVPESAIQSWGKLCRDSFDLDKIFDLAVGAVDISDSPLVVEANAPRKCRIGVAMDRAFHFYYEFNLRKLRSLGAELIFFSPLDDCEVPDVDGLYIGGGYPELFAEALTKNAAMMKSIRAVAERNRPIYAECGGLMYLAEKIVTIDGGEFPMVGLIPGVATMDAKLKMLGYVEVETESETILGGSGQRFRGHQYRYSDFTLTHPDEVELSYRLRKRRGKEAVMEGYKKNRILASYVHAHWASNGAVAEHFVAACARD